MNKMLLKLILSSRHLIVMIKSTNIFQILNMKKMNNIRVYVLHFRLNRNLIIIMTCKYLLMIDWNNCHQNNQYQVNYHLSTPTTPDKLIKIPISNILALDLPSYRIGFLMLCSKRWLVMMELTLHYLLFPWKQMLMSKITLHYSCRTSFPSLSC